MEKKILILLSLVILSVLALVVVEISITPHTWTQTYGGKNNEHGYSILQTNDGGYLALGTTETNSSGGTDAYILKVNDKGALQYSNTIGGPGNDYAYSIRKTIEGDYVFIGRTNSYGSGAYDAWLVRLDAQGNVGKMNTYGGPKNDYAYSFRQTTDSGYIIAGRTESFGAGGSDVYLIKTDSQGNLKWSSAFGGKADDWGKSTLQSRRNGNYLVLGRTNSFGAGGYDFYLIEADQDGKKIWEKTYGGAKNDFGDSMQEIKEGGYILLGWTDSFSNKGYDIYLINIDNDGNELWNKTFGGAKDDYGKFIRQTDDGGFMILGDTTSYGAGGSDIYLIKTDKQGIMQWNKTFGGKQDDYGSFILKTIDGGYIIIGTTNSFGTGGSNVYLIKTDANGTIEWDNV